MNWQDEAKIELHVKRKRVVRMDEFDVFIAHFTILNPFGNDGLEIVARLAKLFSALALEVRNPIVVNGAPQDIEGGTALGRSGFAIAIVSIQKISDRLIFWFQHAYLGLQAKLLSDL